MEVASLLECLFRGKSPNLEKTNALARLVEMLLHVMRQETNPNQESTTVNKETQAIFHATLYQTSLRNKYL
jgi:hypothetical protein